MSKRDRRAAQNPGVDYCGRWFWAALSVFTTPILLLVELVVRLRVWVRG